MCKQFPTLRFIWLHIQSLGYLMALNHITFKVWGTAYRRKFPGCHRSVLSDCHVHISAVLKVDLVVLLLAMMEEIIAKNICISNLMFENGFIFPRFDLFRGVSLALRTCQELS
jgi:hypothetical protein